MTNRQTERGAALMGAVLIIVMLSMLATVSLNVAAQEIEGVGAARDEAAARHLAEAGADLVLQWFHDPASAPDGPAGAWFAMKQESSNGSPSFFDAAGRSQFTGTAARPDVLYDAARPEDDRLLNDPSSGWFRSFGALGRVTRLAVHGPTGPGLLCTVEVTARARTLTRTLAVQLGARPLPPVRAGAQIGTSGPVPATAKPLPVSVHWGDLVVNGDVHAGTVPDIPVKTDLAPVTEQSYAEMTHREDRWFTLLVGGEALWSPQPGASQLPANVRTRQEPAPGLPLDRWEYQVLKDAALRDGAYYARGEDGLLYRDGRIEPGLGLTASDAVRSHAVGDHRGLVFVDTLDRTPPRTDNLGTLVLDADYMEGAFVINADVRLAPAGEGKTVPARSPLGRGWEPAPPAEPVHLRGVNVRGVLATPGRLTLEAPARIHGAVLIGGTVEQASNTDAQLELWYDADLRNGLMTGLPLIYQALGTWLEKYGEKRT